MTRLHQGGRDFWIAALRAEGAAFRAAVIEAEPDMPVPSCPGWSVNDLTRHLGEIYAWVRAHVPRGLITPPGARAEAPPGLPPGTDTVQWWEREYLGLIEVLDTVDPELPAWNWAPQAKRAGFWPRRMAHETSVHRWDAQMAIGLVEPIETKLAVDGVSEVLDTWLPAGRRGGPTDRLGVVHLTAGDAGQQWFLRLRGTGVALLDTDTLLDGDDHHPRVHATGTASDLELALYGRVLFEVLDVAGDASLLECLRTG